jgi:hypothetical protein
MRLEHIRAVPVGEMKIVSMAHEDIRLHLDPEDEKIREAATWAPFKNRCDCCNSPRLIYVCEVVHLPTMTGYYIGRDCAKHIGGLQYDRWEHVSVEISNLARAFFRREKWLHNNPTCRSLIKWAGSCDYFSYPYARYEELGKKGTLSRRQIATLHDIRMSETTAHAEALYREKMVERAEERRLAR